MFTRTFPSIKTKTLAVKLTALGERIVRSGHPWIFSDSIEKINKEGNAGDVVVIFSHSKNKPIGVGLYDPDSLIRIKMVHNEGGAKLNSDFFFDKISKAYALRTELFETKTDGYRLLFGENDGFPGFIADVYADVLVVKLYSAIWYPYLEEILNQLIALTDCTTVILRLSRKLQVASLHNFIDGDVLYGTLKNETIKFVEHGVTFSANVIKGHKTGYFLDHRENRKRVGELSKGKTVLDVFSYAGGFSIHALANNAKEVTSVDISQQALELASKNAKLNKTTGTHHTICGDAFVILKQLISEGKKYNVVVIDPPSFAKSQKEVAMAIKKYAQLAQLGAALTAHGGMLVLASCSSRVLPEDFYEIVENALKYQSRKFTNLLKTGHDVDHPVTFPEGGYLKCGYYKILD